MSRRIFLTIWLLSVAMLTVGCARSVEKSPNEPSNLADWTKQVRSQPGPPLAALPPITPFETFVYDAQVLRDPFDMGSAAAGVSVSGPRPDAGRTKQPLENYALDSLRMVGTIGSGSGMVALVMTPEKVTYRVRPGMYIGQAEGRVSAIRENRIEIVELTPDGAGGWLQRPASIALNSP